MTKQAYVGSARSTRTRGVVWHNRQTGASLVEFSIVALSVIIVALFTLQIGLLYHAKTVINYAVFEAARVGAVNNASMDSMRNELGIRLAPLQGGDGSRSKANSAIAWSLVKVNDPINTSIEILNPTIAAFDDWAVTDPDTGDRFIPVNQLRHQSLDVGSNSGLSLRDANLLKIQVTHGVDLHVPIAGKLLVEAMRLIDFDNIQFYGRGKWPVKAVATVRMQSDSFEAQILRGASASQGTDSGPGEVGPIAGGGDLPGTVNPDGVDAGSSPVSPQQPIDVADGDGQDGSGAPSADPDAGPDTGPDTGPDADPDRGPTDIAELSPDEDIVDEPHDCDPQETLSAQSGPGGHGQMLSTGEFREMLASAGLVR